MTTKYPFQPTNAAPFQFQPTLDGAVYIAVVTWNVFGRRWYLTLSTSDGTRILTIALIGSPDNADLSMTKGYFDSTLVFRESSQTFEVTP